MDTKIFLATPCYGGLVHARYMLNVMDIQSACASLGVGLQIYLVMGESLITRARNACVTMFMQTDCTHLLFVDSDLGFRPENLFRLLKYDKDVSAASYPMRELHLNQITTLGPPPHLESQALRYVRNVGDNTPQIEDGFIEARYVTSGFTLIKRTVFEQMIAAYPERKCVHRPGEELTHYDFFSTGIDPETNVYLSEDYMFSWLWTQLGGKCYMDLSLPLVHIGKYEYGLELHEWSYSQWVSRMNQEVERAERAESANDPHTRDPA